MSGGGCVAPPRGGVGWIAGGGPIGADADRRTEPGLRASLVWQVMLAGLLNGLQLSVSLLALGIYDHVLPGRDLAALAALTGGALALHAAFAGLDLLRARLVVRSGLSFVQALDRRVLDAVASGAPRKGLAALHDVERVSRFLVSGGPAAFFDALWAPLFLLAIFWLQPVLGGFAAVGVGLVAGLGVVAEARSRFSGRRIARQQSLRFSVVRAAGAGASSSLPARWRAVSCRYHTLRSHSAERAMRFAAVGKGLRLMLQSSGLALGALLVVEGAMSAGALLASSILMGRLFASLDAALAHWRGFVAAYVSYRRLAADGGRRADRRRDVR